MVLRVVVLVCFNSLTSSSLIYPLWQRQFARDNRFAFTCMPDPSTEDTARLADEQPVRKRRRTGGQTDFAFWNEFEKWLYAKNAAWGKSIRTREWAA